MKEHRPRHNVAGLIFLGLIAGGIALTVFFVPWTPDATGLMTEVESDGDWPRTLVERFPDGTDGRRVVLASPPQRVVSVALGTDEVLIELIDSERIVALSHYASMKGSLINDRVEGIENFVGADVESIIALQPDLCFLASYNREETRSLLADSGIPTHVFRRFNTLADIRENILVVGQAVGAEKAANELLARMDQKLEYVAARVPPLEDQPTALVYDVGGWVAAAGTTQDDILRAAGLRNAAGEAGIQGHVQISEERILSLEPGYFILRVRRDDDGPAEQRVIDNPAFSNLAAVRHRRLLIITNEVYSSVSHHAADAVLELARQAYPERFGDDKR